MHSKHFNNLPQIASLRQTQLSHDSISLYMHPMYLSFKIEIFHLKLQTLIFSESSYLIFMLINYKDIFYLKTKQNILFVFSFNVDIIIIIAPLKPVFVRKLLNLLDIIKDFVSNYTMISARTNLSLISNKPLRIPHLYGLLQVFMQQMLFFYSIFLPRVYLD